ncbi:MAG: ABC transporter permease [Clostridiaceae bacterium]|jgi:NitT/TauT family transport system permease protein/taurine transport system permease protein|nr:ABC transporter permease [Clostridiaceae bacterium]
MNEDISIDSVQKREKSGYIIISLISLVIGIFLWWLFTEGLGTISHKIMPGPIRVFQSFFSKFYVSAPDGATLLQHLGSSLQITLLGYVIGVAIGIPLGIVMAWYPKFDLFARPVFDLLRPIPGIAWIPVMIVLFGIGLLSKGMVVFLSVFVAITINTYTGIQQTKSVHKWVSHTFGASNIYTLFHVAIPTALPMLMTGLRVALGAAWTTIIAAELLASTKGIGFMIQQSRGLFRPDIIIVGMIAIGITGSVLGWLLGLLEKRVLKGRLSKE